MNDFVNYALAIFCFLAAGWLAFYVFGFILGFIDSLFGIVIY